MTDQDRPEAESSAEPDSVALPMTHRHLPPPSLLAFFAFLLLLASIGLAGRKPAGRSSIDEATADFVIRAAFGLRPSRPEMSAFLLENLSLDKTAAEAIGFLTGRQPATNTTFLAPLTPSGELDLDSFRKKIHRAIHYNCLEQRLLVLALRKNGQGVDAAALLRDLDEQASRALRAGLALAALFALAIPAGIAALVLLFRQKPKGVELTIPPASGILPFIAWIALLLVTSLLLPPESGAGWSLLALLALYSLSGFAVAATTLRLLRDIRPAMLLGLHDLPSHCFQGVLGYLAAIPLVLGAQLAWSALLKQQGGSRNMLLPLILESGTAMRVFIILLVALLAPMIEELIFRGLLYPALRSRFRSSAAIFLTAAAFAVAHLDLPVLLPLFVLGFLLAWLRARTGSILPGCVAHALWNLQTFTLVVILASGRPGSAG